MDWYVARPLCNMYSDQLLESGISDSQDPPHFFSPNFSTFLFLVFLLELLDIYLFRTANLKHIFSILSLSIHQNVYFIVIPEGEAGLQEHLMAQ